MSVENRIVLSNNLKKISVDELMQKNNSTPKKVIDNLVFTRDENDSLQINITTQMNYNI